MTGLLQDFLDKVESRSAVIGVVGIGYVGLPISVSFAEAGFQVVGIDLREEKVATINSGGSHLRDVADAKVKMLVDRGKLAASTSFEPLRDADAVIICVPTPLAGGQPDLSRVVFAGEEIAKVLKPGSLFVLESTTYPGTTEELLQPLLEAGGLKRDRTSCWRIRPSASIPATPPTHSRTSPRSSAASTSPRPRPPPPSTGRSCPRSSSCRARARPSSPS